MPDIERRLWRVDLNDVRVRVQGEGGRKLMVVHVAGELDGPLTVTVVPPQPQGAVADRDDLVRVLKTAADSLGDREHGVRNYLLNAHATYGGQSETRGGTDENQDGGDS